MIMEYLEGGESSEILTQPENFRGTVHKKITPDDLQFVSTFGFKLEGDFHFQSHKIIIGEGDRIVHQDTLLKWFE